MHIYNLNKWKHGHQYNIDDGHGERNTKRVILLTVIMMVVEIGAGMAFGSMALLADGWHMGTHAFALGITAFAYVYARKHADNPQYSFGTGKVGVLGGYTSAIVLLTVAVLMMVESVERFFSPVQIRFNEAIGVAVVGLMVNVVSAFLLHGGHEHSHYDHDHDHNDHHHDHNLKAAYLHVIADAMTSLFAIIALFAGKMLGWNWMDPLMGVVGSLVIAKWSVGLMRNTSSILLDRSVNLGLMREMRKAVEDDSDNRITDFHIWPVGSNHFAAIMSIVTHYPRPPEHYKELLRDFNDIDHLTIEVNHCANDPCIPVS